MKRIIALLLALLMVFSLVACSKKADEKPTEAPTEVTYDVSTVGGYMNSLFAENAAKTPTEIADILMADPMIQFMPMVAPMEEGYLNGFDNYEVKGFEECVFFGPAMGTIPFVGYIFKLADGADAEAFKSDLLANANPRWNICTEADQTVADVKGNLVFFIMCPKTFEEQPADDEMVDDGVGDMDMIPAEGEIPAEDGITLE